MLAPRMMKRCGTSLSMPMVEADGSSSTGDNVVEADGSSSTGDNVGEADGSSSTGDNVVEADGSSSTGDNVVEEALVVDNAVVVGPAREIIKHFVYIYCG